jgi:hypothetical protein
MAIERSQAEVDGLQHMYHAASYLANEGEYDLALRLQKKALERSQLDRQAGRVADVDEDARRQAIERKLLADFAASRLKLEERRAPWVDTLARTAVVSGIIAATFILCFAFAAWRIDAIIASPVDKVVGVLDSEMKAEVPRVTDRVLDVVPVVSEQINRQMQSMSAEMSSYLQKKVDQALDARINEIVDEKLKARAERK